MTAWLPELAALVSLIVLGLALVRRARRLRVRQMSFVVASLSNGAAWTGLSLVMSSEGLIGRGRIYSLLHWLEDRGVVKSTPLAALDGRRVYRLTPEGQRIAGDLAREIDP